MIGILAIQGDFDAHRARLEQLGAATIAVRKPEQLASLDALILPGGESSTMLNFLEHDGFFEILSRFTKQKPCFGTCAGAILLASQVENPAQKSLGALDITVQRNAYGRQLHSSIRTEATTLKGGDLEMVFIRAPKISRFGKNVQVLAEVDGDPVLIRQGKTMAATFHPELSEDSRVHAAFLELVKKG